MDAIDGKRSTASEGGVSPTQWLQEKLRERFPNKWSKIYDMVKGSSVSVELLQGKCRITAQEAEEVIRLRREAGSKRKP
jgi:hypothetical protein